MIPLILVLSERAIPLAEQVRDIVGGEIECVRREGSVGTTLRAAFQDDRLIVGICASGILIRSLAPLLNNKHQEPAVIALAEDRSVVVPLLGGHRGANGIARKLAAKLESRAAMTTASELSLDIALDDPPKGWRMAPNPEFRHFMTARLNGESCRIVGDAPWIDRGRLIVDDQARDEIVIDYRHHTPNRHRLVYHPQTLALGIGCERNASKPVVEGFVREVLQRFDLSSQAIAGVFSIDLKAAEPAVHALADCLQVPARFFPASVLQGEKARLANPSDTVFREVGCHGVAEGAALAAVGKDGTLLVEKQIGPRCTCAVALAPAAINAEQIGRARGQLSIVGLGPGKSDWRTKEATTAIDEADDWVGYSLYLDLIEERRSDQIRHDFDLGEETDRCRHAIALAAEGRRVVLVSSGDPGIYAMATLALELIAKSDDPAHQRIDVRVYPGITAMQAAAAHIGAPLGHDFCAISLSDLLTPWSVIEVRLRAALSADFVIALYNPVSTKRRATFEKALSLIREYRRAEAPVVVARNLGREGESVHVTKITELDTASVDMLTTIIIGSRQTRTLPRLHGQDWVFTPRGYQTP